MTIELYITSRDVFLLGSDIGKHTGYLLVERDDVWFEAA